MPAEGPSSEASGLVPAESKALESNQEQFAFTAFERVFKQPGLPDPFAPTTASLSSPNGLSNLSRLSVWWLCLGISIERIKPGNPQQKGGHQRMHLTLKKEATRPDGANLLRIPNGLVNAGLRVCACLFVMFFAPAASTETRIEEAYKDMYNLQFDDAHRALAEFEALRPDDPLGPVSDAAACLFSEFDRLHILESEFFLNDSKILDAEKGHADPAIRARFNEDLSKTEQLARLHMHLPAERANAIFAETLRLGLHADYLALIEKRDFAALSEMKKARELAEQLLSEHPNYYDAYIAVGVENYLLSLKPAPIRWLLRVGGAETDKQNGLDKLRLTAEQGHYLRPYARLLLAVAALRDGDRKKARDLLMWLAAQYPRNSLYREELAKLH